MACKAKTGVIPSPLGCFSAHELWRHYDVCGIS
jgi:hypothetical protein